MDRTEGKLNDLRGEIDEIDTALHDLIMRRAAIVESIAAAKGEQSASGMRPGREAEILRRLSARHRGPFPRGSLVRIWREIISAVTAMQGPYSVAVFADDSGALWDLSRDHFGNCTGLSTRAARRDVVGGVADGTVTHGVLPYPLDEDDRPWWAGLWSNEAPQIVMRLPFLPGGNARGRHAQALVIARVAPEPTGDDRTLLLIESAEQRRRAVFAEMVGQIGLDGRLVSAATDGSLQYLVEVADFLGRDDERLEALRRQDEVVRVQVIGAYPVPLAETPTS
ncbi:MAG: chorismate mutase [Rhodospirillales bacterium]|nr:MAG: chorismate mutase [Rhodospirillales bacterium]